MWILFADYFKITCISICLQSKFRLCYWIKYCCAFIICSFLLIDVLAQWGCNSYQSSYIWFKVFRSKVLMSPPLKEVLDILTKSVKCIRLVFLHDYRILKETIQHFMKHGHILDFHTTWQPQRCSLPAKCSIEILTLLAGLQVGST